ncbi:MAG: 5'-nucleotidase C-terminal domain-containing protein, partial [Bacteroidota bacterium]
GPEPEAVEIVTRGNNVYALIGLERVGGIIVYDITDPRAPFYVSYVNNRDFSVDAQLPDDSSNPAAGDLGVEDVVYIPAADSPDGEALVVTANEVSGTISLFGVNRPIREPLTLRILHNNDGESKIVADTLDDGRPFGGADRFLTVLEDLRDDGVASVTLSSGDNYLPGKAFNASLARPAGSPLYDSEVLNAIGYDALVIGNHDFDFGPDILQRVVEETAPSGATFLSANLDFSAEPGLQALVNAGRIAKSEIVEVAGQPIGVIGLTTTSLPTISTPRGVEVDSNLVAIAQGEIDSLTGLGVSKIILISHLQDVDEEIMLAGQLEGIDVIIAGGGDELLTNDPANALGGLTVDGDYPRRVQDAVDSTVYIVTTPGEYRYVGNLTVDFDEDGFITGIDEDSDVVPVVGDIDGDPAITPIVDSINLFVADLAANIIATTEVDLNGLRASVRTIETNQGNLITDAYLWFFDEVSDQFDFDPSLPVIAVQNGGGIRDDEVIAAGSDISEEKTFDILPFSNFVSVLEPLTPTELKSVLENSVSRIPDRSGRFLQVAGFELVYDTIGTPDASRVIEVTLDDGTPIVRNGTVLADAPSVYVVTNSFTADGGDDYDEFGAKSFVNIGPSYQRVLFDYLVAEDGVDGVITAEQYPAGGEGRIRLVGDNQPLTLRILHNNDGESKIVADTLDDGRPFGGADRFLTVLEDLRDDDVASVTLSSGDNYLPGKAFNASLARPAGSPLYDSEVLNAIGYDALVIGNHDFDFGPDILQRVVEETAPSGATFLSANLDFSAEPGLQALVDDGRIAKSEVVLAGDQLIGVIGLTTISLP